MLTFTFTGVGGTMTQSDTLTSGMVGRRAAFVFSPEWDGLQKTAVFVAGDICCLAEGITDECEIPADVLAVPLRHLYVGVYGVSADGKTVIPTRMARGPRIEGGADPALTDAGVRTVPVWRAIQQQIGALEALDTESRDSLVDALNEVCAMARTLKDKGVTPYTYAVEAGYTGTEEALRQKLLRPYAPVARTPDMVLPVGLAPDGRLFISPVAVSELLYPVGSLYITRKSTNPAGLFGGAWIRIRDCFILAAGDTYPAGSTGGEASCTLTEAQLPAHSHGVYAGSGFPIKNSETAAGAGGEAFNANRSKPLWSETGIVTDSAGGAQAHNNMPPYLACYIWERIA